MQDFNTTQINWQKMQGLVPAIVQDKNTSQVLMLGYMNEEALNKTLETKLVTFYSRSKGRLWTKGETSSNFLKLHHISYDCDGDALLLLVNAIGPTCHQGTNSCFQQLPTSDWETLKQLEKIIKDRLQNNPTNSYTASLVASGINRVAQKVGEEAVEVVIAATTNNKSELITETADLLFHTLVLLEAKEITLSEIIATLKNRMH